MFQLRSCPVWWKCARNHAFPADSAFCWKLTVRLFGMHSKIQPKYFVGLDSVGNKNLLEVDIAHVWQPFFPAFFFLPEIFPFHNILWLCILYSKYNYNISGAASNHKILCLDSWWQLWNFSKFFKSLFILICTDLSRLEIAIKSQHAYLQKLKNDNSLHGISTHHQWKMSRYSLDYLCRLNKMQRVAFTSFLIVLPYPWKSSQLFLPLAISTVCVFCYQMMFRSSQQHLSLRLAQIRV